MGIKENCPYSDFASCSELEADKSAEYAIIGANPTLYRADKNSVKASQLQLERVPGTAGGAQNTRRKNAA